MGTWWILQIILNIYLCGFVIYYIVSFRKKEYDLIRKQHHKEKSDTKKINETLQNFLQESESATHQMIEAFKREHQSIKQSINYLNMKMEEMNSASNRTKELLNNFKESIPNDEVKNQQSKLKYKKAADLLSQGFAPSIIAHKLNMPVGEVELVSRVHFSSRQQTI